MSKRRFELDTRILAIFFLVAMPFVAIGAYIVVGIAESELRESVALGLEQRAVETQLQLERYVGEHAVLLRLIGADPDISGSLLRAVAPLEQDEERRLNEAWSSGERELLEAVVGSRAAEHLRRLTALRPGLRLVQVVDSEGRLVVSSARAGRVTMGPTDWFVSVSQQGLEPRAYVGDVVRLRDDEPALYDVAWPIRDDEGVFVGAVRAAFDASDLYTVLAPVRIGRTGHAVLLHGKTGRLLSGDDDGMILESTYPGFAQLNAAMAENRGTWQIPELEGRGPDGTPLVPRLVGYSHVSQLPGVEWIVAVEQDAAEASAPIDTINFYLWLHFIGAFGTAILLGLYFSFRLEEPVIEEELHLHEQHIPPSDRAAADASFQVR
jgi:hypothetical protein